MAQDIYAPLEGKKIAIENLSGAFRKCRSCGGTLAVVSVKPVGMHHGQLTCTNCGEHCSWLQRDHLAAMLAAHSADEREAS